MLDKLLRFFILILFFLILPISLVYGQDFSFPDNLRESISGKARVDELDRLYEERKSKVKKKAVKRSDDNDRKIVLLRKIDFSKSDLLPITVFIGIRREYENTQVSMNDIYNMVNIINNEYILRGFIAAHAYLDEQDITSGHLFISMIEGSISQIRVINNKTTSEKYIRKHLDIGKVNKFNSINANQYISNFNAANDAKLRIALSPGETFGTSIVDIIADEPNRFSLNAFSDNAGQEETGITRYGGYFVMRSLTRYRDIFNIGGVKSEGSNALYGSYEIPEPFFDTRVGVGFDYSDTQMIAGGLENLNVTGNSYNVFLYIKRPFFVSDTAITNFTFNTSTKKGESYISSFKTQETHTDIMSLSGDNTVLFNWGYLFNMLTYSQGMKLIEGDIIFEKISYYGDALVNIYRGLGINIKIKGQYAFETLISSEQISIGGVNTVRGYREGMLSARDGISSNIELQYNVNLSKIKIIDFLRLYTFFDFGELFPDEDANLPDNYGNRIYSTGIGMKFGIFNHIDANIVYAVPLLEHEYYKNSPMVSFMFQGRI